MLRWINTQSKKDETFTQVDCNGGFRWNLKENWYTLVYLCLITLLTRDSLSNEDRGAVCHEAVLLVCHSDRRTDGQTDRLTLRQQPAEAEIRCLDFALSSVGVAKRPEIKTAGLRDEHRGGGWLRFSRDGVCACVCARTWCGRTVLIKVGPSIQKRMCAPEKKGSRQLLLLAQNST